MKKKTILIPLLVLFTGSILSANFGPWWASSIYIILASALMHLSLERSLLLGALTLGVIFFAMTLYTYSNDHAEIIQKTGALFGGLSPFGMISATTLIGITTGTFSGWLGSVLGDFI